jgi:predicted NodU family carbamoyl transferase
LESSSSDFQTYADIAASAQLVLVEVITKIFKHAYSLTSCKDFLFSGGVAMNSASIRSILKDNDFIKSLYIPPSPGDAGAAIGAAYYGLIRASNKESKPNRAANMFPSRNTDLFNTKTLTLMNREFEIVADSQNNFPVAAELIAGGTPIATCFLDVETGPRALGHRSLICDGTSHSAVKHLNEVIKGRNAFRPTAPAMTMETAKKYYNLDDRIIDLYYSMSATCSCKEGSGSISFPTTHFDGTARLQIVESSSLMHLLLEHLGAHGKYILANTSLNLSSDPIAYDLIDVMLVALRSNLLYILTEKNLYKKRV